MFSKIVDIAIAGSNDHVYTWFDDRTVISGTSSDFGIYRPSYSYSLPAGKSPGDILGIGIAGSNDHCYAWYKDGTVSSGTSSDLDKYRRPYRYSLPVGKSPDDILGIGIAGSNDHCYAWYKDGTVSSGTSSDLDKYRRPHGYSLPAGKSFTDIVGIGIAGSNDHCYAWYKDGTVSSGTSSDLDKYRRLHKYRIIPHSYEQIRLVRPNLGNPLILEPQELKRFEITVAYSKYWKWPEKVVPYFSQEVVEEILQQNPPRIECGDIVVPLSIFRVHSYFRHPPYKDNYRHVKHAETSAQQQYRNNFRWELRVDVGISEDNIKKLKNSIHWPTLLDLSWPGHWPSTNKSALYIHETLKRSNEFTILHITDTHIAKRNDQIPELLCQVRNRKECDDLKARYVNFNDNLRAFIKEANERVNNGENVIVVLTGDIVDYYFDGYWDGKFICGQAGQNAPDRREQVAKNAWDSNLKKFREIILGEDGKGERLLCPIFTVLGNHDYYMNEILLNFKFGTIFKIKNRDSYKAFGLDPDEGREYDFWAFPRVGGNNHVVYIQQQPTYPLKIPDSIAIRKTFKEIIRNKNVLNMPQDIAMKDWKASLVDFVGDWSYWLIKPKSWQLSQYLCEVNYDLDFELQIGDHHLICLNTGHDEYPNKDHFIFPEADYAKDFINGGPHNRGFTDHHIKLLQKACEENCEKSIYIFTHAPLLGLEQDGELHGISRCIKLLYEHRIEKESSPPNETSKYLGKLYGLTFNDLKREGFHCGGEKYFYYGTLPPLLNFSCAEHSGAFLAQIFIGTHWMGRHNPVICFSGHTHKVHEFRVEKTPSDGDAFRLFISDYSEKELKPTENGLMLTSRYEWLKKHSPLLLTSGALKNETPQYREVIVRGKSLASLQMKDLKTIILKDIKKKEKFTPGCQIVALRAHNGQYICAENGGSQELVANRNSHREWETFEIIELENNQIALKACNGKFVRAKGGGGGSLKADRYWIGSHETFELVKRGINKIALRAHNGQYVCAENGGGQELIANRDHIREWETFRLVHLD